MTAETSGKLPVDVQHYIEELKGAVYEADDLLDEFATLAQLKHNKLQQGGKISGKFKRFFAAHFEDLGVAYKLSQRVKAAGTKLDGIANKHKKYDLKLDLKSIPKKCLDRKTGYYVKADEIIGREGEKQKIVGMLLDADSNAQRDVSFLSIVGMGGLGKTTLAQLVYNDDKIKEIFPLRLWVCVGDENREQLNVTKILSKLLGSKTGKTYDDRERPWLEGEVRKVMTESSKFLFILDDMWNENPVEWKALEDFFKGVHKGNWVVMTTRSIKIARIVNHFKHEHILNGLSDNDSWDLFKKMAFQQMEGQTSSHELELAEIGKDIVKKCANIPLAICVAGSLLRGQDKRIWQQLQSTNLGEFQIGNNSIVPILKVSYDNLEYQLKNCFAYCALFPKDSVMNKEELISLWMAQGYVVPSHGNESLEEAAERYFLTLLQRCFFQDVTRDYFGEIETCKMHDLMHDVACQVAGKEIYVATNENDVSSDLHNKMLHFFDNRGTVMEGLLKQASKLRTIYTISTQVRPTLKNCMYLRTLILKSLGVKDLPASIGKLLHLRYLDLSENEGMEMLPESITKLHNLQTLNLSNCASLKALPNSFRKLVNLRLLGISGCDSVSVMPSNMGMLSCLCRMPMYVVNMSKSGYVDRLEGLKALSKLEGSLFIKIMSSKDDTYNVKRKNGHGKYLENKQYLKTLWIALGFGLEKMSIENYIEAIGKGYAVGVEYHEALMEDMQPHYNLTALVLCGYGGARMPSWGRQDNITIFLPNLVKITFYGCQGLEFLPSLSKLHRLRELRVGYMKNLEYMEDKSWKEIIKGGACGTSSQGATHEQFSIFSSLVMLELEELPKLKMWWRDDDMLKPPPHVMLPYFPLLSHLEIKECPKLCGMPLCPNLEELEVTNTGRRVIGVGGGMPGCRDSSSKLWKVTTENTRYLKLLFPMEAFQNVREMWIRNDAMLERLEDVGEIFQSCSSSLFVLRISYCENVRSVVRGGLEYLTSLEELTIQYTPNLSELELGKGHDDEDEGEDGMPWKSLPLTLHHLRLVHLPEVLSLPNGIRYLTSLTSLEIINCSEELTLRCRDPSTVDRQLIHHIPNIRIQHPAIPDDDSNIHPLSFNFKSSSLITLKKKKKNHHL